IRVAAASDDSAKVCEEGARLDALARDMVAADKDFAPIAQDLLAGARPALERARALAELSSIPLEVSAIVVGGGDAPPLVNGRIVAAGEFVPDAAGVPIPGLVVEGVKRRRVKLSYKGHVFEPRRQLTSK